MAISPSRFRPMRNPTRLVLFLGALLAAARPASAAEQLHKCLGVDAVVSYQSAPCAADERAIWTRPVQRDETLSEAELQARRRQILADAEFMARLAGGASTPPSQRRPPRQRAATPRPSRCELAQSRRAAKLDQVGLKRTFALLSRLDAEVERACSR